ncbi:hypothetical protein [Pseudomonas sp. ZS1P83]
MAEFGDVHLVQLNNEPTYAVNFTSGNPIARTSFEITDALDWLERDLKSARAQGKIIILNMPRFMTGQAVMRKFPDLNR